jgi:hypothetical protein
MTASDAVVSISARILAALNEGSTVQEAMDMVLGEGTYVRLAGEVYDSLNARRG